MLFGGRSREQLQALAAEVPYWWHSLDLGKGVVTRGAKTLENLEAELVAISARASTWDEASELSRFNRHGSTEPFEVSPELATQVEQAVGGTLALEQGAAVGGEVVAVRARQPDAGDDDSLIVWKHGEEIMMKGVNSFTDSGRLAAAHCYKKDSLNTFLLILPTLVLAI